MENLNYVDLGVVVLVCLLGVKGFFSGLIREFFSFLGIVGGVYIASRHGNTMGYLISTNIYPIDNVAILTMAGFIVSLAMVWITCVVLAEILSKSFDLGGLGAVDGILGFAFSSGKIFLIFGTIFYSLSNVEFIHANLKRYTAGSVVYPLLIESGSFVIKTDSLMGLMENSKVADHAKGRFGGMSDFEHEGDSTSGKSNLVIEGRVVTGEMSTEGGAQAVDSWEANQSQQESDDPNASLNQQLLMQDLNISSDSLTPLQDAAEGRGRNNPNHQ